MIDCDLGSLASVKACAESFRRQKLPLHVLVRRDIRPQLTPTAHREDCLTDRTSERATIFGYGYQSNLRSSNVPQQINNAGSNLYGVPPFYTKEGVGGSAMVRPSDRPLRPLLVRDLRRT